MPVSHIPVNEETLKNKFDKNQNNSSIFYATNPKYEFADIVLPENVEKNVRRAISYIKNRHKIFDEWEMKSVIKNYNLCINLYGPSGTGKTMTAHAIANELNKKLVVVNYAEIESKYVGETSKNIVNLFKFAQQNDLIILFDEADALLSKRVTAMYSATDVSVNQTRNTLLKIFDEYDGIVIFTTNFVQNFDMAFLRRIFSNIEFELPNLEARKKLWSHYLLGTLPIDNRNEVIIQISQEEELTGSDIATIVLKAAVDVAEFNGKCIDKDMLINIVKEVKKVKYDMQEKYEITTRKVSKEYVKEQLGKGGNIGEF